MRRPTSPSRRRRPHSPQAAAEATERLAKLPPGTDERFVGYGVIGLTWSSGHVLGLRRWPASSVGPAYTSVWHRGPDGRWRLFSDVGEQFSCSRYIGRMVSDSILTSIRLTWVTPWKLRVVVGHDTLIWELQFKATLATSLFGLVRPWLSAAAAASDLVLGALERSAPLALRTGPLRLRGLMPNGQRFRVAPSCLWVVDASSATLGGESLGVPARAPSEVRLGDFIVPQSGILAFASARFR